MLKKRIIPCLDVKDGRVVKGVNFVKLRDAGDPADCARAYADQGADEIAFLDITASTDNRKPLVKVVERTAKHLFVPLTVGGGIKGIDDIRDLLNAGADKITLNTMAVMAPDIITQSAQRFGSQCIVVAIDAKRTTKNFASAHEVYTHGGTKTAGMDALEWAERAVKHGCGEILLTSIDRDGTRAGYNLELTRLIADKIGVPVIASGGVGTLQHFYEGLTLGRASAVLAASVFHFGEFTIRQVKKYLRERKVPVRL